MQISALNNLTQSFSSNTPIYRAYVRKKDGTTEVLPSYKVKGPALALVQRLNNIGTRESKFMQQYIGDYASYPIATSSIWGRNVLDKKHIIYGDDAVQTKQIREASYRYGDMTEEDAKDRIRRSIIDPLENKARLPRFDGDKVGEQIGLVLYTDEVRPNYYKLNGIKITSLDGRVYASLEPISTPKPSKKNSPKANISTSAPVQQTPQNKAYEDGYLFDVEEFTHHPNRWELDNEIKPRRRRKV